MPYPVDPIWHFGQWTAQPFGHEGRSDWWRPSVRAGSSVRIALMYTPPHITAPERDALYSLIVSRLTGLSDLNLAIEAEDWVAADRLSLEFAPYLRLLQDLGWGDRGTGAVMTTPPEPPPACLAAAAGMRGDRGPRRSRGAEGTSRT